MSKRLPVFPLGTVLFPGLVLSLHIFEERYRALVRELVAGPSDDPHEFGVVTLRRGAEAPAETVTTDGPSAPPLPIAADDLYQVGCTAELRQVTELSDGRYDIMTVGRRRFLIKDVIQGDEPYLTADVEWLPDESPDETAELLAPRALAAFRAYLELLRPDSEGLDAVPADPTVLSHLIAATAQLTTEERQSLLAAPDTAARLRTELKLLNRESGLLARVRAVPVPLSDLARPASPN
ncbi:LON peptidase substrate-binding domain-containing protein [Actinoplanes sp. NPDC000266]